MNESYVQNHQNDEYTVIIDKDNWSIVLIFNHLKSTFHYKIKTPNKVYLNSDFSTLYAAIDAVNQEKTKYKYI